MDVEYAFLADAGQVIDGKLYVLGGGFDRLFAQRFPTQHPVLSLIVALKVYPPECNRQHSLEIQLWDPDGHRLGELRADFTVQPRPDDSSKTTNMPFVFNIVGQQFPRPGPYAFYILANGEQKKTVPLDLALSTPEGPPKLP